MPTDSPCSISTFHCKLSRATCIILIFRTTACLGISLGDILPSWLKRFVAISSSNRSYTSSSRNTSSPEGAGPYGSCRSSVNWGGRVCAWNYWSSLPACCASACLIIRWGRWMCKTETMETIFIPPNTTSRARSNYSPTLDLLFIPALFILFWVWCTDPVGIKQFISYDGVRYKPDSPY